MSCFGLEEVSYKVTQYTVTNVVPLWWMCCEWIPTGDNINIPHKFVSVLYAMSYHSTHGEACNHGYLVFYII